MSRVIERAQKKVELHHFDMRKHVLEYDDVMNVQRENIYGQRRQILEGVNLRQTIISFLYETIDFAIANNCLEGTPQDQWDIKGMCNYLNEILPLEFYVKEEQLKGIKKDEIREVLIDAVEKSYKDREEFIGEELMRDIERYYALEVINRKWIDHLDAMDFLREGIGLRGYAQKDPIVEYKKEAYELFQDMINNIQDELVRIMYRVQPAEQPKRSRQVYSDVTEVSNEAPGMGDEMSAVQRHATSTSRKPKVGRNEPCPCGSGKKYKKCCMDKDEQE
jgi:preprotein translocase subunit SecA